MFKRKDVIRSMYLIAVILVIMVTLSQILVVHRQNHRGHRTVDRQTTNGMLILLQQIERSIEAMTKKEFLPARTYEEQLKALIYAERISQLIAELNCVKTELREKKQLSGTSYTVYRERKLRFLEVSSHKPTQRAKASLKNESVEKDFPGIPINGSQVYRKYYTPRFNSALYKQMTRTLKKTNANKIMQAESMSGENWFDTDWEEKKYYIQDLDKSYIKQNTYKNAGTGKANSSEKCPEIPKHLEGKISISSRVPDHLLDEIEFSEVQSGGLWKPMTCIARQRISIIVPYRGRKMHLHTLLHYLIPVLMRQLLEFRIFVIEQSGNLTFNKGRVMNAGFTEAWKLWTFDCVIFHDVDLLPENDKNMYTCGLSPRHMSISVDKFNYRLPYMTLVGGVFSIKRDQFLKVNGYSNLYWGWGAEDDDMALRLKSSNLKIERPPANIGRYKMIRHATRETSPVKMRSYLLKTVKKRYHRDGLNTLDYTLMFVNNTKLFTHVMVDIGQPPTEAADITKLLN